MPQEVIKVWDASRTRRKCLVVPELSIEIVKETGIVLSNCI